MTSALVSPISSYLQQIVSPREAFSPPGPSGLECSNHMTGTIPDLLEELAKLNLKGFLH